MTPRERVERLVNEETTAMVVRIVRKMAPRSRPEAIAAAAQRFATPIRLLDSEVEAASPMSDDEIRASWRATYERDVTAMLATAGELPS